MRRDPVVRWMVLAAALAAVLSVRAAGPQSDSTPHPVRAAMLQWRVGIERNEPASEMLETIVAFTRDGRRMWRVTHYPFDPANSDGVEFDSYDVDASSFAPIRSLMRNPGFELSLSFEPDLVLLRRTEKGSAASERIPLDGPVKPEGPGHRVFVAGLPLRPGYTLEYRTVDRWGGHERSRIKEMTLSVLGRRRAQTALGPQDVLDVVTRAVDGSFQIAEQVRSEAPHYPLRMEYRRGTTVLISDVTTMVIDQPLTCVGLVP